MGIAKIYPKKGFGYIYRYSSRATLFVFVSIFVASAVVVTVAIVNMFYTLSLMSRQLDIEVSYQINLIDDLRMWIRILLISMATFVATGVVYVTLFLKKVPLQQAIATELQSLEVKKQNLEEMIRDI
jgi:hypothetical protein